MFLGTFAIDEYVNIPAVTHRFSSGAAYAPTSITYSIYEEGNTTGIDEDVDMAPASPFDSVAGLYLARRQLTAAAGFEANKTYLVVVKATVDGIAAIDAHLFQVRPIQSGDSYAIVSSGTYGNSAIKTQLADIHDTDLPAVKADTAAILEDTGTTLPGTLTDIHGHASTIDGHITADYGATEKSAIDGAAQASADFNATQKASLNAATPAVTVSDKTGFSLSEAGVSAVQSGLSTLTAAQVWAYASRSLTTFGSLVSDIWGNSARTLTSISDSSGITTLLSRIASALTITGGKVDVNDKTGFSLDSAYDPAKTAAQASTALSSAVWTPTKAGYIDAAISSVGGGSAPTASEIADAVLDEALSGHLTAGTLGRKINDLSSSSGSGSIEWDLPNVYKTGTTTPIADVDVWITTDEAGDNVIASGKTDAYGTCKFYLDAGTVYVWCQKTGYNFTNPTEYTVA